MGRDTNSFSKKKFKLNNNKLKKLLIKNNLENFLNLRNPKITIFPYI